MFIIWFLEPLFSIKQTNDNQPTKQTVAWFSDQRNQGHDLYPPALKANNTALGCSTVNINTFSASHNHRNGPVAGLFLSVKKPEVTLTAWPEMEEWTRLVGTPNQSKISWSCHLRRGRQWLFCCSLLNYRPCSSRTVWMIILLMTFCTGAWAGADVTWGVRF